MNTSALRWSVRSLIVAMAILSIGCSDETPVGLAGGGAHGAPPVSEPTGAMSVSSAGKSANQPRGPELAACPKLAAPAGSKLAFHVYAEGVQIYRWTGTSWGFIAPSATLSSDAGGNGIVGTHYAGPTWESNSGGTVKGAVIERCTPNANAIPWLLLGAVAEGPGVFHRVTHIQRVNTVGGNAPAAPGSFVGEEARVPYTTEYFFYRS